MDGWDWEGKNAEEDPVDDPKRTGYDDFSLVVTGEVSEDAKKIAVSPEEEGYPILLEATYGMDKLQIGGFCWEALSPKGKPREWLRGLTKATMPLLKNSCFIP